MTTPGQSGNTRNSAQQIGQDRPTLLKTIRLLTACLKTETEALQTGESYDVRAAAIRKSRFLLDMTRASKGVDPENLDDSQHRELGSLKTVLDENAVALRANVAAVRDIGDYFQELVEDANSDGTYSRPGY